MNPPGRDSVLNQIKSGLKSGSYRTMAEGRLTARNSKKAAQLRRVITMGYYSPAEILLHVLLFIPCRPRLPARAFFAHKKSPSGEGLTLRICIIMRMVPGASR